MLGEFTTAAGGGADLVAAAICTLAGDRGAATTAGPDGPLPAAATAATETMATRGKAGVGGGTRRATPLTAHANTKGAIVATLNAGFRVIRTPRWRSVAGWISLNLETPGAVSDLHTTAGSLAGALRRWRAICLST